MFFRTIVFLISILISSPAMALEFNSPLPFPQKGVFFDITPSSFEGQITGEEKVTWIGQIEDVSYYINEENETILEYYCRHLIYVDLDNNKSKPHYIVKSQNADFFIFKIKAPEMSTEAANNLSATIEKNSQIAVVMGIPYDKSTEAGRTVAYITGDQIITANDSIIEFEQ